MSSKAVVVSWLFITVTELVVVVGVVKNIVETTSELVGDSVSAVKLLKVVVTSAVVISVVCALIDEVVSVVRDNVVEIEDNVVISFSSIVSDEP